MEKQLFNWNRFVRFRTLKMLEATTEQMADVVPTGFNNSIRWNLGHILASHESLLLRSALNVPMGLSEDFLNLFKGGTKPADWAGVQPPSLNELKTLLIEQQDRLEKELTGKFNEKVPKPFKLTDDFEVQTVHDMFNFAVWHEGLHQGTISSLKFAQGVTDLWTPVNEKEEVK